MNSVAARAAVVAEPGDRLSVVRSQVPLVLRRTAEAVYLVGAAGGPVGGDRLELRVEVRAGAVLRLRTVAATVVLPGPGGAESVLTVAASVEAGGTLEYLPEPTVVADGARHLTDISVDLAAGASLVLRDELVLGRHNERGGACRTRLRVDYGDTPLLRHEVAVDGTDEISLGPAILAGRRAYGTVLLAGTEIPAGRAVPGVAVMPLAGPGVLISALATDSLMLRRDLADALGCAMLPLQLWTVRCFRSICPPALRRRVTASPLATAR
jgi:urease accessory protein